MASAILPFLYNFAGSDYINVVATKKHYAVMDFPTGCALTLPPGLVATLAVILNR